MKYLLALLGIMCCLSNYAQNKPISKKSKQIWIGLNLAPVYNYRTLSNNGGDAFADQVIHDRNNMEKGRIGYVTGMSLSLSINSHLDVETGVFYANRGYETKIYDIHYSSPAPGPIQAKFIYKYRYIDVPMKLRFVAGHRRLRFTSSAGVVLNFSAEISDRVIYRYSDGRMEKRNLASQFHYKSFNLSPVITAGVQYNLNKKTYLRIEPVVQYGLLKTIDMPVTEHLWSAGVNMGIHFRFR